MASKQLRWTTGYVARRNAEAAARGKALRTAAAQVDLSKVPAPAPPKSSGPKPWDPETPCEGCVNARPQPASWSGVECAAGLFLTCKPLSPGKPKLYRAVS